MYTGKQLIVALKVFCCLQNLIYIDIKSFPMSAMASKIYSTYKAEKLHVNCRRPLPGASKTHNFKFPKII